VHVTAISVPTRAPAGHTNAYLVGETDALLVDPADRTPELDAAVDDRNVAHLALTHTHPDHVGGVAEYAAETGATVWCRRGREDLFAERTGITPDETFGEGSVVPADDGGLNVLDTPGHAVDHVAFEAPDGAVLGGDLAVAEGSVTVAAPEGDVRAYLSSLRRLYARNPPVVHPGHGPRIDDPRAALARLLERRLYREDRVRDAVGDGARTLDEVLDDAYDKDLGRARKWARKTVVAHLEKLDVEGDVRWDPDAERVLPA